MKINKKCQSTTSFSINNGTMHTLPLTSLFYDAIRINSFNLLWSTLSKPLHNSLSATQHMDSTTPKITISKSKYQIQTCNMFQTAVCCRPNLYQQVQCIISSNINSHCHFYLHNLIFVNDDALTLIGNKSAIPCRFLLQLLWIVYQILLQWYPQVAAIQSLLKQIHGNICLIIHPPPQLIKIRLATPTR